MRRRPPVRDVRALACFAVALVALAVALVLVLSHPARRISGRNGVPPSKVVVSLGEGETVCQAHELLPAGTAALRVAAVLRTLPGPRLLVTLRHGRRLLGRYRARAAGDAIVPIRTTTRDVDGVEVCLKAGGDGGMVLYGSQTPPNTGQAGTSTSPEGLPLSLTIEYLRAGKESWWARASAIATHMGRGRGHWGGPWVAWAAAALVLASLALAGRLVLRTLVLDDGATLRDPATAADGERPQGGLRHALRRVPPRAWSVMAIGLLNAAAWSLITPMFQVPDEFTHIAYVEQIAETGRPPSVHVPRRLPPDLATMMVDTGFGEYSVRTVHATVWAASQQRRLQRDLDAPLSSRGNGDAGPADPEPPLYYALAAIPYRLAVGATLLDRIALMRLLSALLAGFTALFVLLFVRECLPGRPWAWTVGGLGAAFAPMLGFISGGVNPDALLFAVCGALLLGLARAFRRGVTTRLAVWIGVALAVGMVGKINFYGVAPGAVVALALAARASEGAWNARVARLTGVAVAVAVVPFVLLSALDALVWNRAFILAHTPAESPEHHGGLASQLGYLWQVYLPRLPGQAAAFPDFYPGYELWFKSFVGNFGWLVVPFPPWAYRLIAVAFGVIAALVLHTLATDRAEVRRRRAELLGYGAIAAGLLLLIGMVALRGWAPGIRGALQGRYLLPLLPLFAAVLALGARGAGERWGRAVGAVIVVGAIAGSIFAQLTTIAFFYG